jgi:thioredoxin reductase
MLTTSIAVVGAGPYGPAAAAYPRRAMVELRIFGDPTSI